MTVIRKWLWSCQVTRITYLNFQIMYFIASKYTNNFIEIENNKFYLAIVLRNLGKAENILIFDNFDKKIFQISHKLIQIWKTVSVKWQFIILSISCFIVVRLSPPSSFDFAVLKSNAKSFATSKSNLSETVNNVIFGTMICSVKQMFMKWY